jgi:hypothetical protein
MYHVWRRSPDGYVHATNTTTEDPATVQRGLNSNAGTLNGEPCVFTVLFSTGDWEQARERVLAERAAQIAT